MLDPTLRAAFVAIVVVVLRFVFQYFNVPVSDEVLGALAVAIIAWIFGNPAGKATAQAIQDYRTARAARAK